MSECTTNVQGAGDLNKQEADALLQRLDNLAKERSAKTGQSVPDALRDIAGEIIAEDKFMAKVYERNALLTIKAKRDVKDYARRFKTFGDGILTLLEGSSKIIPGARRSMDYQAKFIHGKYFGRLVADLESAGLLKDFKRSDPEFVRDVYREMGALHPGMPAKSISKNDRAFRVAQILDNVYEELVARQNRAGAFIPRMPGYVVRQTHDMASIRALGGLGNNKESLSQSFKAWKAFVAPLLDTERTFRGVDPEKFLKNVHEGLYTGIHGPARNEGDIFGGTVHGSLAKKASEQRVLHFKDADSAYKYNQAFGVKNFKEAVLQDIHVRARSIALMENFGPSPDLAMEQIIRELQEEARSLENAGAHVDSLKDWRIKAAFDEITGRNEVSKNPTLSNMVGTAKVITQMSKMGAVTLSSLADRAFLQSEMAFQGISNLKTLTHQILGFAKRSPESKRMLRLMGVAMDGMIGNSLSRYSNHSTTSGWAHTLQKWFFDLNGLNLWTDTSKATAAELMAAHLGEHAGDPHAKLPADLAKVLSLYDITPSRWDAIRSTVMNHNGQQFITTDSLKSIPSDFTPPKVGDSIQLSGGHSAIVKESTDKSIFIQFVEPSGKELGAGNGLQMYAVDGKWHVSEIFINDQSVRGKGLGRQLMSKLSDILGEVKSSDSMSRSRDANKMWESLKAVVDDGYFTLRSNKTTIAKLVQEDGLKPSPQNIQRMRDKLETSLGTYFQDRVDIAVPTPGVAERKYSTFGTQAGTPLGEAVRMVMLFKSFPITILNKVVGRNIYGNGSMSVRHWLANDHRGKFNLAMLMAMGTVAGYMSGAIRDALKGREPKPLFTDDGKINMATLNDAAVRGGSLGILGDVLMSQYTHDYHSFLDSASGPMISQLNTAFSIKTDMQAGKNVAYPASKLMLDNTPFINLFYARPLMDYFILWNLQEMMSPGSLRRSESAVERRTGQQYFMRPSETVNH